MPDSVGTFERIAGELAKMFQPLETRLASGNLRAFLAELGLALPPELLTHTAFINAVTAGAGAAASLPPLIVQLVAAIEAENVAQSVTVASNVVTQVRTVITSIDTIAAELNAIGGALPGISAADLSAFATALPERLIDFLVVTYLEGYMPGIARTLALPGIVEIDPQPGIADPAHPAFVRKRLRLDRIGQAFADPDALLRDVYGWGSGALNSRLILDRLHSPGGVWESSYTHILLRALPWSYSRRRPWRLLHRPARWMGA